MQYLGNIDVDNVIRRIGGVADVVSDASYAYSGVEDLKAKPWGTYIVVGLGGLAFVFLLGAKFFGDAVGGQIKKGMR